MEVATEPLLALKKRFGISRAEVRGVVAQALIDRFPRAAEGELSRLRANLVNQQALFEVALELDLGTSLRLGEGEARTGGHRRPSILADAFEAVVGAVFLDAGYDAASAFVVANFDSRAGVGLQPEEVLLDLGGVDQKQVVSGFELIAKEVVHDSTALIEKQGVLA
jgi:hypothetical protein